jgi:hypothetical protein
LRRDTDLEATLVAKYVALSSLLNERARRLWAAAESVAIGYGAAEMRALALDPHPFHGDWNYTLRPRPT